MSIEVKYEGPLFDGQAAEAITRAIGDLDRELAQRAVDLIQAKLKADLKHPTGRYQRAVSMTNRDDSIVVSAGSIVYGPWLEGVSRRNNATRFKGYAAFRTAAQKLQAEAGDIAADLIGREIGSL